MPDSGQRKPKPRLALALLALAALLWAGVYALQNRGGDAGRLVQAGMESIAAGQPREAEKLWRRALELDPRNAPAWELLGDLYLAAERWDLGWEAFRKTAELNPGVERLNERLAICASNAGNLQEAHGYAEAELKVNPNSAESLSIAATALFSMDDEKKELSYLRRLAALRPSDPSARFRLGKALTRLRSMEEARAELSEAIRLAPDLPEAYGVRGRTWLEGAPSTEALAKAEADLRKAVELAPNGPTQRFHLARALRMTGRNREALPLLKEARALMPKNPDIPFEMARVLETLGASKEAEAARAEFGRLRRNADEGLALEKRCTVAPQDGDVHARAGLFYLGTGEADKAEYYLERAALLQPGNESVNAARKRLASLLGRRA